MTKRAIVWCCAKPLGEADASPRTGRDGPGRSGHVRSAAGHGLVRALVYAGYQAAPQAMEVADPACPADGVVIAVGATGVCRSDWHAWQGHNPVALPHIGGHQRPGFVTAAPGLR